MALSSTSHDDDTIEVAGMKTKLLMPPAKLENEAREVEVKEVEVEDRHEREAASSPATSPRKKDKS